MYLIIAIVSVYVLGGISASLIYHRILTHKVVQLQPWFEKTMVVLALPAGTPVQWVGTHRKHHLYTDVEGDPHSPIVSGFWYAHCGWYILTSNTLLCVLYALAGPARMVFDGYWRPRTQLTNNYLAADISKVQFYNWLSTPNNYMVIMWLYALTLCSFFYYAWGITGIITLWILLVVVYNIGDSVNSFGHLFGQKKDEKSNARNNALLSIVTFGEGHHANHHNTQQQLYPNNNSRLSISKLIITSWNLLGLIKQKKNKLK